MTGMGDVRGIGCILVPVLEEVLDFRDEQATGVVEFLQWNLDTRVDAIQVYAPAPSFNADASSSSACVLCRRRVVIRVAVQRFVWQKPLKQTNVTHRFITCLQTFYVIYLVVKQFNPHATSHKINSIETSTRHETTMALFQTTFQSLS